MNPEKRTLIDQVTEMQNQLATMKRKLKSGKKVDFEATEKVFFDFVSVVHHGRIQFLLDEMHRDSEDARKKLLEYLKSIPKPAGIEEPKLETEKPAGDAKTEPESGKPEGTEEVLTDIESIGKIMDNAIGYVSGIFDELKIQSKKARGKAGELAGEVSDAVKPTLDDLTKKGGELWDTLTSAGKDMVKKKAFTPEFNSGVREELLKRHWKDEGIDVALSVFYKVLADMDKKKEEK